MNRNVPVKQEDQEGGWEEPHKGTRIEREMTTKSYNGELWIKIEWLVFIEQLLSARHSSKHFTRTQHCEFGVSTTPILPTRMCGLQIKVLKAAKLLHLCIPASNSDRDFLSQGLLGAQESGLLLCTIFCVAN